MMRSTPRKLVGPLDGPTTDELLARVQHALMEISTISATMRDLAAGTRADRVNVRPAVLRNYFTFQAERSDAALELLRQVFNHGKPGAPPARPQPPYTVHP